MLNPREWFNVIPSSVPSSVPSIVSSLSPYNINLYKRWRSNRIAYYLKNINTISDCIYVLKCISSEGYDNSDKMINHLNKLYLKNQPSEVYLAKLSLLHQSVIDTYGIEEFAILTLWISAIQSIIDAENKTIENLN